MTFNLPKPSGRNRWLAYVAGFMLILWASSPCLAASSAAGSTVRTTPETLRRLSQLSPKQIEELDRRLAKALTLYYDGRYGAALPILREISRQVTTVDILFWLGGCAHRLGQQKLAEESYRRALAINPKLHRVRLELALVLFEQGRLDEAKREFKRVLDASPPDTVRRKIEKLLGAIDQRQQKVTWSLRLWAGYLWDDNISFGPALRDYNVPGGSLTPSKETAGQTDQGVVTNLYANMLYDVGDWHGLMWNTELTGYNKSYLRHSEFNYQAMDLNSGPWWWGKNWVVKLPVGYTWRSYGSDRLSQMGHVDPNFLVRFNRYFGLAGTYSYSREWFFAQERRSLDNDNHRISLTPKLYLGGGDHILSFSLGYENHRADDGRYTYKGPYLALSYYGNFSWGTELFLRYQYNRRDYQDPELFYDVARRDRRHSITAMISQTFWEHYYVSFTVDYTKIESNVELYDDVDRTTYTLGLGLRF